MDISLLALPLLALADSTSVGTFVIPALALLAPGPTPVRRLGAYLAIVAGLYFLIGVALLAMADAAAAAVSSVNGSLVGVAVEGGLGAALVAYALWPRRRTRSSGQGRISAWRTRALDPSASFRPLATLAVLAVAVEAVSMLPYIGAVALIAGSDMAWPLSGALLLAYCMLMILPAVVLMLIRSAAREWIQPWLTRIDAWSRRSSGSKAILWATGLVGGLLVADAIARGLGY